MNMPGMPPGRGLGGGGDTAGMSEQEQNMVKHMQAAMEACPTKSVMAGTMGFALGGAFGLFMSSMSYDTPMSAQGQQLTDLPVREQLRRGFKDMGSRSYSSAKNFALVGAIFSGVECGIEGVCFTLDANRVHEGFRAKNDLANGVAAGCITGGALGAKAGPSAAAIGCAGFAAFSAAIDYYMRMPSDH
ncbi:MAG: Mitochondrial import inner membrane translocase subunit tim22 [Candelaria pacifica]|nr:MAG: Mitochondrial import inner membrane translocase subunit tim22 [Candelaria pacifica]